MYRLVFILSLIVNCLFVSCKGTPASSDNKPHRDTQIEFTGKAFDFGNISEGEIVTHIFYFKNTGKENFVIHHIESGCGCTTVDYDKIPILPGKEGKIEIAFNSSGRYGKQYKEIRIFANISGKEDTLKFTANVQSMPPSR